MIDKRIVGACNNSTPVHKRILPHIAETESARIWEWSDRALKIDLFPTVIEEAMIVWINWISAYKIRACAHTIVPDDIR